MDMPYTQVVVTGTTRSIYKKEVSSTCSTSFDGKKRSCWENVTMRTVSVGAVPMWDPPGAPTQPCGVGKAVQDWGRDHRTDGRAGTGRSASHIPTGCPHCPRPLISLSKSFDKTASINY